MSNVVFSRTLCLVLLMVTWSSCGPAGADPCQYRSEKRCARSKFCRAETGSTIDFDNMCIERGDRMAFCHRRPFVGCPGDVGAYLRSPTGECWSIGNTCYVYPEGWYEDPECAGEGSYRYCPVEGV